MDRSHNPPAPKTRAQRQEETRRKLLDAARVVFTQRGFHGATLDEIARHAGYTKGAVYANFAGKDELFMALIDRHIDQNVGAQIEMARAVEHGEEVPAEDLASFFEQQFDQRWAILALEALLYAARERPEMMSEIAERYRQVDAATTQYLKDKAVDPPDNVDLLAIGQGALGEGLMLRHLIEPERITHEVIERVVDAVFDPPHRQAWREEPGSAR